MSDEKVTNLPAIQVALLRVIREEMHLNQATLASYIHKKPSTWQRIESGRSALSMLDYANVCLGLGVYISQVTAAAERYAHLLSQNNWTITQAALDADEDTLLKELADFFASPGYKNNSKSFHFSAPKVPPVINTPWQTSDGKFWIPDVFQFVIDDNFRAYMMESGPLLSG